MGDYSEYEGNLDASGMRVAIVAGRFNDDVTKLLLDGALHELAATGLDPDSVPVVIQRSEWEAGKDADAIARNFFQPLDYEAAEGRVELVEGDHDLLGDGAIELLATPGHTPGHQSVRVGGSLILAGDAIHYASTLDDERFPVFAEDPDAQAASAGRLKSLRDDGATVLSGHDPEQLRPGPVAV